MEVINGMNCYLHSKRKGFSRILVSAGGALAVVILGVLSLYLFIGPETTVRVHGPRLTMAPDELVKFRARPVFDSGYQITGMDLFSVNSDSVLLQIGLKRRDVIKVFNGERIQSVADLVVVLYRLYVNPETRDNVRVEIIRDNRPLTIAFYAIES